MRSVMFYFSNQNNPNWVEMEHYTSKLPLPSFIYSDAAKKLQKQVKNPILKHMIKVWHDVRKYLRESNSLSQFTPIRGNQLFIPGRARCNVQNMGIQRT